MEALQNFNIDRLWLLIKRQAVINSKSYTVPLAASLSILFLFVFFNAGRMDTHLFMSITFPFFLLGGYIYTSAVFKELNNPLKSYFYMMLPASAAEKTLAAWLLSSVGFLVAGIVSLYLLSFISAALGSMLLSTPFFTVDLFCAEALKAYAVYCATQTVFLAGALAFKSMNFFKTIIFSFFSFVSIGIFSTITVFIVFGKLVFSGYVDNLSMTCNIDGSCNATGMPILAGIVFMLFFVVVSFFKLKERQV